MRENLIYLWESEFLGSARCGASMLFVGSLQEACLSCQRLQDKSRYFVCMKFCSLLSWNYYLKWEKVLHLISKLASFGLLALGWVLTFTSIEWALSSEFFPLFPPSNSLPLDLQIRPRQARRKKSKEDYMSGKLAIWSRKAKVAAKADSFFRHSRLSLDSALSSQQTFPQVLNLRHDSSQHIFGGETFDWRWLNGGRIRS